MVPSDSKVVSQSTVFVERGERRALALLTGTLIRTVSNSGENMIASQLEIASDQSQKGKEMISV